VRCHAVHPVLLAVTLVAPFDPAHHFRVFVSGVVGDDGMEGQAGGGFLLEVLDEVEPFLVSMALGSLAEYLPVQVAQRGK
jgi:hypothetical protein